MKLKNFMELCGLGLFAVAGASAFAASKSAAPVKADADTWMINATFNAKEIATWDGVDLDSFVFRCGVEGQGGWVEKSMSRSGADGVYNANVTFADSFSFSSVQIKFTQGGEDKYSLLYSASGSKESHYGNYYMAYSSWASGNNFNITLGTYIAPYFTYNDVTYHFDEDVANARYICRDVPISEVGDDIYYTFHYHNRWDYTGDTLTESTIANYFSDKGWQISDSWCVMRVTGTYDVILKNDGNDGGIIEFKLHEGPVNSYIYYVLENNTPTNDYIYSWGGSEQFGAWPGTKVTEVAGVSEVSGNGVMHFQGSETPKLIYKIPVIIGYPSGDSSFKWNNNYDWQSEGQPLVAGAAYWYTGPANADAGAAIDFIVTVEAKRNAATGYSVCNISAEDSAALVDAYGLLDDGVKAYVDSSSTYTHKRDGSEEEELVSFAVIMEQLAKQAGGSGSSASMNNLLGTNGTMVIVILATVATTLASVLLIVKFRKRSK